jgi:hypothetical protein
MIYLRRHPQLIAFTVLVASVMLALVQIDRNAKTTAVALCQTSYDSRQIVVSFVMGQTQEQPVPPGVEETTRIMLERQNERRRQLRKDAQATFKDPACVADLGLRPEPDGRLVKR